MPLVDVETLVSTCVGGIDRKVNCETLAKGDEREDLPDDEDSAVADIPPESFWLSKDAELDWYDRNAFFERKESGKGIINPTNLSANQSSNHISQKFSKNLKSSLFGLPNTHKTNHLDSKRKINKPALLFPKRTESTGKSSAGVVEPSSPKVSCIGRVRSKRCRRKSGENKKNRGKSAGESRTSRSERKKGFYSRMFSLFKVNSSCAEIKIGRPDDEIVKESKKSTAMKRREFPVGVEPEPPIAMRDEEVTVRPANRVKHDG